MTEDLQEVVNLGYFYHFYINIYWIYNISLFRKSFTFSTEKNEITVLY